MDLTVIYDSKTDNTKRAAEWIADGMNNVPDVCAKVFSVDEASENADFIKGASGAVIGCPTYAALMTPAMRDFLMGAGESWAFQASWEEPSLQPSIPTEEQNLLSSRSW